MYRRNISWTNGIRSSTSSTWPRRPPSCEASGPILELARSTRPRFEATSRRSRSFCPRIRSKSRRLAARPARAPDTPRSEDRLCPNPGWNVRDSCPDTRSWKSGICTPTGCPRSRSFQVSSASSTLPVADNWRARCARCPKLPARSTDRKFRDLFRWSDYATRSTPSDSSTRPWSKMRRCFESCYRPNPILLICRDRRRRPARSSPPRIRLRSTVPTTRKAWRTSRSESCSHSIPRCSIRPRQTAIPIPV